MKAPALADRASLRIGGTHYPIVLPSIRDPRLHLAAIIITLQVLGQVAFDFRLSIAQILVSLATAGVLEFGLTLWRQRVLMWPASALLTGNGVAFVLRVPGTEHGDWWSMKGWYIFAGTAAVALLSKYVIRVRGAHVFNPSNFGLVLCFLLLGAQRADPLALWWGPLSPALVTALVLIVVGGFLILRRLHLVGIAVGFWLSFAAGIGVLALSGHEMTASWHVGPIAGGEFWWLLVSSPEILVFLFFMITDPKTIPKSRAGRRVYAIGVGLLATVLIAPFTSEFATKVAILGSLAIVCGVRGLVELVGVERIGAVLLPTPRRAVLGSVALGGAILYGGLVVAAGVPARPEPGSAAAQTSLQPLPTIDVVQGEGIADIDMGTAQTITREMMVDLQAEYIALRDRDMDLAATAATGEWLATLQRRIRDQSSRITVGRYHVDHVRLRLAFSGDQSPPLVLVRLAGTQTTSRFTPSGSIAVANSTPEPVTRTLELVFLDGRYRIASSNGGGAAPPAESGDGDTTTDRSSVRSIAVRLFPTDGRASVRQGEPFRVRVIARNESSVGTVLPLVLQIRHGSPPAVAFFSTLMDLPKYSRWSREVSVTPSQWFSALGRYEVSATVDGHETGRSLAFDLTRSRLQVPRFEDVTATAGLETTVPEPLCGQYSSGAAWSDVDGDADLDLFLTRLGEQSELFINDGAGHFEDEADQRGVAVDDANGAAFADYDNDGDHDLYVVRDGADILFENDGNGEFIDRSTVAGIEDMSRGMSASWGDYDNDGYLDLYVTNYMLCGDVSIQAGYQWEVDYQPDVLYHNNRDGTFTDSTRLLGNTRATAPNGAGFAAAWFDYNNDDRLDLYLANDSVGLAPDHNRLWRNDGPAKGRGGWRFTDVSRASASAFSMNTMGIGIGDFNRDLRFDLALSNIGATRLLRNSARGVFVDVAKATGVARPRQRVSDDSITWGAGAYDFNLDGWEDLYFAAGNIYRELGSPNGVRQLGKSKPIQPNELFVNDHGERFVDLSAPSGAADSGDSKGVAFADWDHDGRMDMFVVNQAGAPRLYRNVTPRQGTHWLEVDPVGTHSNRDGCGTRVVLTLASGAQMIRQVFCGSTSVSSGSQDTVHFGLSAATKIKTLEVLWPSGARTRLQGLRADELLTVREPK